MHRRGSMRGWGGCAPADPPKATKNPVITKTGLDILRYICSGWFGLGVIGYSFFLSHAPAVRAPERPSLLSLTLVNVTLSLSSFHLYVPGPAAFSAMGPFS